MAGFMTFFLWYQVAASLLLMGLAVPLIRRRVGPNLWYGFRVPRTLNDRAVWFEANAFAGKCLLATGLINILSSVVLYFSRIVDGPTYAIACTTILLVALATSVILSFRFLDLLTRPPAK